MEHRCMVGHTSLPWQRRAALHAGARNHLVLHAGALWLTGDLLLGFDQTFHSFFRSIVFRCHLEL